MRGRLECAVEVAVPAELLWRHVTDWPRQQEWVPLTRVERVDAADGLGGRFRAWTGIGPVGFWDPMTITTWERDADGGGRCEVLHRGRVVRGEGQFSVVALGEDVSRFVWAETVVVPGGSLGGWGWRFVRPLVESVVTRGLGTLKRQVEAEQPRS